MGESSSERGGGSLNTTVIDGSRSSIGRRGDSLTSEDGSGSDGSLLMSSGGDQAWLMV